MQRIEKLINIYYRFFDVIATFARASITVRGGHNALCSKAIFSQEEYAWALRVPDSLALWTRNDGARSVQFVTRRHFLFPFEVLRGHESNMLSPRYERGGIPFPYPAVMTIISSDTVYSILLALFGQSTARPYFLTYFWNSFPFSIKFFQTE